MTLDANDPSPSTAVVDSQLRCPACDYNLTGIADRPTDVGIEYRCPECGNAFDPEHLKALLAGAPAPIPIWDSPDTNIVVRFIHMCLLTWFAPHRLARRFPNRCHGASVRCFGRAVLLVACLPWIPPALTSRHGSGPEMTAFLMLAFIALVPGLLVCEGILGGALSPPQHARQSSLPMRDPQAREQWSGIVPFFRSFLLLELV